MIGKQSQYKTHSDTWKRGARFASPRPQPFRVRKFCIH